MVVAIMVMVMKSFGADAGGYDSGGDDDDDDE